jgi:hypothetical protein
MAIVDDLDFFLFVARKRKLVQSHFEFVNSCKIIHSGRWIGWPFGGIGVSFVHLQKQAITSEMKSAI